MVVGRLSNLVILSMKALMLFTSAPSLFLSALSIWIFVLVSAARKLQRMLT